jgi:cytochrome c biogenesis factor
MNLFFLSSFNIILSGSSDLVDFWSRTHLNESLIHQYYFFWTSSNFLGFFFWLHCFLFSVQWIPNWVVLLTILFVFYLSELVDFLQMSCSEAFLYASYVDVNILLSNNLNKYHPFLFFITSILLLLVPIYMFRIQHSKLISFCYNHTHSKLYPLFNHLRWLSSLTLFLGSWWALQEGTWGGWWNWDPSEVLGLVLLITPLVLQHSTQTISTLKNGLIKTAVLVLLFTLLYFFTQLNFDLVSHNFGNRFNFFFINTLFFIDSLLVISLISTIFILNFYWRKRYELQWAWSESVLKHLYLYQVMISLVYILPVVLSFSPLVTYFLWQTFQVSTTNLSWDPDFFVYIVILLFFFSFTTIK